MPYLFEFTYHNPTQIVFGPNSFAKLGSLVPADAKVEIEAKIAAGYFTDGSVPDAQRLASVKGRGLE